jgi:aminoglycoside phosphotransferase (APT) family kinase protein
MCFGDDLAFNQASFEARDTDPEWLSLYELPDGTPSHIFAWVYADGEAREITLVRRNVVEHHPRTHVATKQEIEAEDQAGMLYRFRGEAIAAATIPAWPNFAMNDTVYRWEDERGRVSYGSYQEGWWDAYQRAMTRRIRGRTPARPARGRKEMALLNTLDADTTASALEPWLADRRPGATALEITELEIPQSSGMSMTTVMLRVVWQHDGEPNALDLVARVAPEREGTLKNPDLVREFQLLKALARAGISVPDAYWVEENRSILGSPFMILQRVHGRVPADDPPYTVEGWVMDLVPAARSKIFESALDALQRIHAVDWRQLGLLDLLDQPEFGATGIDQQLGHWEDSYEWAAATSVRSPLIESALGWAKANRPPDDKLVLSWVDARPGNMIFGEDLSVRAVLDWEMATIASPQLDIGWMAFMTRFFTEGIGVSLPAGMPSREQLIARYEQLTGNRTDSVDYYEIFAALVVSIVYLRVASLMIAAGKLPPDSPMAISNPPSQILARLLELRPPEGESVHFVGHR